MRRSATIPTFKCILNSIKTDINLFSDPFPRIFHISTLLVTTFWIDIDDNFLRQYGGIWMVIMVIIIFG